MRLEGIFVRAADSTAAKLLKRPELNYRQITAMDEVGSGDLSALANDEQREQIAQQLDVQAKYSGYIERQEREIATQAKQESLRLPEDINYESVDHSKYRKIIKEQKSDETYSNLASLLSCYEIAKKNTDDLVFFVEDDYIHFEPMLEEMVASYERISSQIKKELFMCPADYPYLYMNNNKTNVLIGNKRHWRTVQETLCTFMTSKELLEKHWDNFYKTCLDRYDPFEKYINEIYKSEICISPLKSLSVHFTNVNSSYGLSPFIDYQKLWDEN